MDTTIICRNCTISSYGSSKVEVDLTDADIDYLQETPSIKECIKIYGFDDFLDEIGEAKCKEYFGLVNIDDVFVT